MEMEIPLNAPVACTDGLFGKSVFVVINPVVDKITHVVVKEDASPNTEYLVPMDRIAETLADTIRLSCSKADMKDMAPFNQTVYIKEEIPKSSIGQGSGIYGMGSYVMPYATADITVDAPVDVPQIPSGELTIQRGTRVEASDGFVGHVDEFVINPANSHITHLVMREGHLWGKKDVMIPVSAISDLNKSYQDIVLLNIDKHQIEELPTFPLHRKWS